MPRTLQVYEGELPDGTRVAVKVLKRDATTSKGMERLLNESETLRKCTHECLVPFLGACLLTNEIMLVMELVPGGSLWQALHARSEVTWEKE